MPTKIIGAGLAGLIAACHFKDADVIEAGRRIEQHKALLRFRDKSVSEMVGVPFKEVIVHKEINFEGKSYDRCNVAFANMYSSKVAGRLIGRSVWNLDTVARYIAPPDFYDTLVDKLEGRISWNTPFDLNLAGSLLSSDGRRVNTQQIVSTIPLPAMLNACGLRNIDLSFEKASIRVDRYRLPPGSDVYQTIYYPDRNLRVYRASVSGDVLIVESLTGNPAGDVFSWSLPPAEELERVLESFGGVDAAFIETVDQKHGKIVDLPREQREAILYELTRDFNVFSIGRFATWRNILLDDVAKDVVQVERLMNSSSYGRRLVMA